MTTFLVGFVVGISLALVVAIVVPWTRRIRAETGMDPELEARALLGRDPEPEPDEPPPDEDHHRDYDPGEIRALRNLGKPVGGSRRRKR